MLYKDHFWVDEKYVNIFESASLLNSQTFFDNKFGQVIREEPEKSIRYFEITSRGLIKGFYIKYEKPGFLSHVKWLFKKRSFYSLNTRHELKLIRLYQRQGVSVVEPVALGEQCVLGIPIRGFLIQREVVGTEFIDLMKDGTAEERVKLARAYGKFVADLHSKELISTVPRVNDLICTSSLDIEWQNITLVVIDREKGPLHLERFSVEKVGYALSSILFRFVIYIDIPNTKEVLSFLRTYFKYLQVDEKPSLKEIFMVTVKYSDKMTKKYNKDIGLDDRLLCVNND